ncbi:hypothetical protein [Pseudomonas zhanjiangensis]|uniref:Uncharacterized protein n=1 Tax=Pseudomonas zhanjiangensis TaxID=3239015 RepID=A0ABV3YX30_9PSED
MHEPKDQAIQTSVATALLGSILVMLPCGLVLFLLAGDWLRAERTALLALVLGPAAPLLRRELMRQMGGELSYVSPPGEGATFHADFLLREPG